MEVAQIADLVSHGGVVALALVVWYELREHRKSLELHRKDEDESRKVLAQIGEVLGKILERDRFRDEISGVHQADPRIVAMGDDEPTPVEPFRKHSTPAKGSQIGGIYHKRKGTLGGGGDDR